MLTTLVRRLGTFAMLALTVLLVAVAGPTPPASAAGDRAGLEPGEPGYRKPFVALDGSSGYLEYVKKYDEVYVDWNRPLSGPCVQGGGPDAGCTITIGEAHTKEVNAQLGFEGGPVTGVLGGSLSETKSTGQECRWPRTSPDRQYLVYPTMTKHRIKVVVEYENVFTREKAEPLPDWLKLEFDVLFDNGGLRCADKPVSPR